jgi:hypothetical protein
MIQVLKKRGDRAFFNRNVLVCGGPRGGVWGLKARAGKRDGCVWLWITNSIIDNLNNDSY